MIRKHIVALNTRVFVALMRTVAPLTSLNKQDPLKRFSSTVPRSIMSAPQRSVHTPRSWSSFRHMALSLSRRPAALFLGATIVGVSAIQTSYWLRSTYTTSSVTRGLHIGSSSGGEAVVSSSQFAPRLVLHAAAALIPHPAKEDKGGEDAFFISSCGLYMGVADGVGGWAEVGVDPGLYSRELMAAAAAAASNLSKPGPEAPQQLLEIAHSATKARGSSTACIVCLENDRLHASNLGDSGFMLIRAPDDTLDLKEAINPNTTSVAGEVGYMSPQQQHEFNFPYQIGSADSMSDPPQAAQRFTVEVMPGDVLIIATDGLFDNVYPDEAASVIMAAKRRGDGPGEAALMLAQHARTRAGDPAHLSPFAYGAQQLGYRYFGGKMDDITVLCAYVTSIQSSEPLSKL